MATKVWFKMKNKLKSCSDPSLLCIFSDFYFIFLSNPTVFLQIFISHSCNVHMSSMEVQPIRAEILFFPFKSEDNFFSLSTIHDKILNFLFLEFNKSTATHAAIALKCTSSPAGIREERFTDHS